MEISSKLSRTALILATLIPADFSKISFASENEQNTASGSSAAAFEEPVLQTVSIKRDSIGIYREMSGLANSEIEKIKRISSEVSTDISCLENVNPHYSGYGIVRHGIRLGIYNAIQKGTRLQNHQLMCILNDHLGNVPDLAILIGDQGRAAHYYQMSKPGYTNSNFPPEKIVLYNPRFNTWYASSAPVLDEKYVSALLQVTKACELLNIKSIGRFDNGFEIIRNRYLISSDETKHKLEDILGKEYFEGIKRDDRPVCILLYAEAENDHNGAFRSRESQNWDAIDQFSSAYQTFYFESSKDYEAIGSAIQVAKKTNSKISFIFLGGHGSDEAVSLGKDSGFSFDETRSLDTEDGDIFKELTPHADKDMIVVAGSCSTGNGLIKVFYDSVPMKRIIGPDDDTSLIIKLDSAGMFADVEYHHAKKVIYPVDAEALDR